MNDKLKTHSYDMNNSPILSEDLVRLIRARIKTGTSVDDENRI